MNCDFEKKPGKEYIWSEIKGNPNLYCWIPAPFKDLNLYEIDISDINVQDIPPPKIDSDDFEESLSHLAETAVKNKQLEGLKKIRRKNRSDEDLVSVDERKKYDIVRKFINKRGLKLYGGTAINAYLPKEEKIYTDDQMPDYDFFSPDPWTDATSLADEFYNLGYKFCEAKAGFHKGTYKVFVNLWPVADITFMPKEDFDRIETKKIHGLNVVSPFKLIESMYKEFSEPFANPDRWPKVAVRQKLLEKWTKPLASKFKCSSNLFIQVGKEPKVSELLATLLEATYKFIEKKKLMIRGGLAYNTYLEIANASKRIQNTHYEVLSEKADKDIHDLQTVLLKIDPNLEIMVNYYAHKELNDTEYSLYCVIDGKEVLICSIIHLTSCTPYKEILGRTVVSIDYLKYELYYDAVFKHEKQDREDAKCKIKYLDMVQNEYYKIKKITELDVSPFQRFITICKGPFRHNLKVEILHRWQEKIEEMQKVIKESTPEYRIRKYPRSKPSKECMNKNKEECMYPCAWNKYIGACSNVPKGTYRAGDNNEEIYDD